MAALHPPETPDKPWGDTSLATTEASGRLRGGRCLPGPRTSLKPSSALSPARDLGQLTPLHASASLWTQSGAHRPSSQSPTVRRCVPGGLPPPKSPQGGHPLSPSEPHAENRDSQSPCPSWRPVPSLLSAGRSTRVHAHRGPPPQPALGTNDEKLRRRLRGGQGGCGERRAGSGS